MDERVDKGDWVRLDNNRWEHFQQLYYVHLAEYRENSTAVSLTLEDNHGNIFTTVVASHQIIKE